jgi:hypothetical protein
MLLQIIPSKIEVGTNQLPQLEKRAERDPTDTFQQATQTHQKSNLFRQDSSKPNIQ